MRRSAHGRRDARAAAGPAVFLPFLAIVLGGCLDGSRASATAAAPTSNPATPTSSLRLPTPVPTAVTSPGPSPTSSAVPATGRLLVRFTVCSDTCSAVPGTTFLDDGTMLWEAPNGSGQVLQARLTQAGIRRVRAAIEGVPALAADGTYRAVLRPGAVSIPHGISELRFDVQLAADPVFVTAWDPASLADQAERWVIPPEMPQLAEVARKLQDPVAWLGEDAFLGPPAPYHATGLLVRVDLFPNIGTIGAAVDVDDVDWPFAQPIETAGDPLEGDDVPAPRCLVLTGDDVGKLRAAERAAGVARDPRPWESSVDYEWKRGDGFAFVAVRQLLPYQTGTCAELLADRQ